MFCALFFLLNIKSQAINFLAATDHTVLNKPIGLINYTCDSVFYEVWKKNNRYAGQCLVARDADHGSYTRNNGDKIKLDFIGTKVHVLAWKQENSGKANIRIDNKLVGNPSFNSGGGRSEGMVFTSDDLEYGPHTIEIEHNDTDDARSMVFGGLYVDPLPKVGGGNVLSFANFGEREGTWTENANHKIPAFSCDEEGCSGTFRFYGSRFWLTGVRSASEGNMQVIVDNGSPITVTKSVDSQFTIAQGNAGVLLYSSNNLGTNFHTVKVKRTNQKITLNNLFYVETENGNTAPLPAVDTSVMTNPTGLINLTCDKFQYEGWDTGGRGGVCVSKGDADHGSFTRNPGATATINFIGSKLHILAWKQENSGNAKIIIDGKLASITNFNSGGGRLPGMVFTSNGLSYGPHTLVIQHNDTYNTKSVVLGSIYVDPLPYYGGYALDFDNLTKRYGDWSLNTQTSPSTFECSSESCDGTFEFYGTRFWITGLRSKNCGNFKIIIDNKDTINVENAIQSGIAQNNIPVLLYQSEELEFKKHEVKIYKTAEKISFVNFFYTIFPYAKVPEAGETPVPQPPSVQPDTEDIYYQVGSDKLGTDRRVEKEVDDYKSIKVIIDISSFSNLKNDNKGGAVHVVNCGVECRGTNFNDCESKNGGGGGMYISETYDYNTKIKLSRLTFQNCKAQYGGGLYLYSSSEKFNPEVQSCKFINTVSYATSTNKVDGKYGGSGIHITAPTANIGGLEFNGCSGTHAASLHVKKMINAPSSSRLLGGTKKAFIVSDCTFTVNKDSSSAIYCVVDKTTTQLQINRCTFKGNLATGKYYIDAKSENKNSPKILVKKCRFATGVEHVFDKNNLALSVDLNDQTFNFIEGGFKESSNKCKILVAVVVPAACVAVIAIAAFFIVRKRKNPNVVVENHVADEAPDASSTQSIDQSLNASLL